METKAKTESYIVLTGNLSEILGELSGSLNLYPRRQPGKMLLEGKEFHYVDLHSFYHQALQIFGQQLYNFEACSDSPVVIDGGAHIGLASLYFAQRFPHGKIIAFEADQRIYDVCKTNLEGFGVSNVDLRNAAVWVDDKGVAFRSTNDDSGEIDLESQQVVPSIGLKDFLLQQSNVELLKLDIEGAEFSVLRHCKGALAKVNKIIVEIHCLSKTLELGFLLSLLEEEGFRYVLGDLNQAIWLDVGQRPPFPQLKTDKFLVTAFAWKP